MRPPVVSGGGGTHLLHDRVASLLKTRRPKDDTLFSVIRAISKGGVANQSNDISRNMKRSKIFVPVPAQQRLLARYTPLPHPRPSRHPANHPAATFAHLADTNEQ